MEMRGELARLEAALLEGGSINLEQGALIASGVRTEQGMARYMAMLDQLWRGIAASLRPRGSEIERAREIFHWLWRSKPHRYRYRGNFRLSDVLEAQLSEEGEVGNCLGLTVLFNVIGQRFGLEVRTVQLEDAFGIGPHVFTVLYAAGRSLDIENVFPHGFDYQGHKGNPQRQEWGDRELIADIYHSVANGLFEQAKLESAIRSYDKAIRLNPQYIKACLNKGVALVELGRVDEAREWLEEAGSYSSCSAPF